jgi:hypothetical protein
VLRGAALPEPAVGMTPASLSSPAMPAVPMLAPPALPPLPAARLPALPAPPV